MVQIHGQPVTVEEHLRILGDSSFSVIQVDQVDVIRPFGLLRTKEGFGHGTVPAIRSPADALKKLVR